MSEWAETTLGEVGTFSRGRRFTKQDYVPSGLGCIHYGQLYTDLGTVTTEALTFLDAAAHSALRLAAPGDVVIAATSENVADLGKATAWLGHGYVAVHDDCLIFKHELDPVFASLLLAGPQVQHQKIKYASETKVTRISAADMAAIRVQLPPLCEQRRIATVVSVVDFHIEASIAAHVSATEARLAFQAGACASLDAAATVGLGDIADVVGGVTKDKKKETAEGNIEAPYLRVANVQRGYLDLDNVTTIRVPPKTLTDRVLKVGDLLLNEGGDRDKLGRGWVWEGQIPNCVHQNHVHRARIIDQDAFLPRFVSMWANTFGPDWFSNNGGQTNGIASISISKVRQFPVPIVPIARQQEIVSVEDALRGVEDTLAAELATLRTVRADLLAALLSQEVTIDAAVDKFVKAA